MYKLLLLVFCCLQPFSGIAKENKLVISGGIEYPLIHAGIGKKQLRVTIELDSCYSNLQLTAIVKKSETEENVEIKRKHVRSCIQKDVSMSFTFTQSGFYLYDVFLTDLNTNNIVASASTNIAIVPERVKPGLSDFGTCTHFGQGKGNMPYSLDLIKLAGFSSIRDEIYWGSVEKTPGIFNFNSKYDLYVNAAVERKLKILLILGYGNPVQGEITAQAGFPLDDSGRKRFAQYASELVKRYKNKIFLWELWNEPSAEKGIKSDEAYYDLLKVTYRAVKAIQPEGKLICSGGAPNLVDGAFVNPILKKGGAKYMDGFAMHTYVAPFNPEDGYETKNHPFLNQVSVPSLWPLYRRISEQYSLETGNPIEAWITEMGWHTTESYLTKTGDSICIDELRQAAYITRLFLLSRRYNTTKSVFLYDFQNDGTNLSEREHNFGIIRQDYSPKAAYSAISVLTHYLQNKQFVKAIKETPDTKIYCYGEENEELIALWSVNRFSDPLKLKPKSVSINLGCKKIKWVDWQGHEKIMQSKNGIYTLLISQNPSFILFQ